MWNKIDIQKILILTVWDNFISIQYLYDMEEQNPLFSSSKGLVILIVHLELENLDTIFPNCRRTEKVLLFLVWAKQAKNQWFKIQNQDLWKSSWTENGLEGEIKCLLLNK